MSFRPTTESHWKRDFLQRINEQNSLNLKVTEISTLAVSLFCCDIKYARTTINWIFVCYSQGSIIVITWRVSQNFLLAVISFVLKILINSSKINLIQE